MSTILDALKKVEQERTPPTTAEEQRQLNALQPGSRAGKPGMRRKLFTFGILCLTVFLLSITTYWVFRDPEETRQPRDAAKTIASVKPKPMGETSKTPKPSTSPQPQIKGPPPANAEGQPNTSKEGFTFPSGRPSRVIPSRPTDAFRRPSGLLQPTQDPGASQEPQPPARPQPQNPAPTPTQPPLAQSQPQTRVPEPPPPKRELSTSSAHGNLDRLNDGSLKVQAIAWSPVVEERMAVINSKIVREGSSVDDYTIITIDQDEVVVRKDGRMLRVLFGRP